MDNNYVCPKCGQRNWKMTSKKNKLKCITPYCSYVSDIMAQKEMDEYLNYIPIPPT